MRSWHAWSKTRYCGLDNPAFFSAYATELVLEDPVKGSTSGPALRWFWQQLRKWEAQSTGRCFSITTLLRIRFVCYEQALFIILHKLPWKTYVTLHLKATNIVIFWQCAWTSSYSRQHSTVYFLKWLQIIKFVQVVSFQVTPVVNMSWASTV